MADNDRTGDGEAYARRLSQLEDEGANVLVVGSVPEEVHVDACRRLLGGDEAKRRLVVLCGRDVAGVGSRLDSGVPRDPEHLRVVEYDGSARSTAADGGSRNGSSDLSEAVLSSVEGGDRADLGATVSETVDTFEAISGGLDPGELRMCLDSLSVLVGEHGETDVFGFLHILTERLTRAGAVAGYHLQEDHNGATAGMLGSLFDVVVDLRVADGQSQYRWDRGDGPTEWAPLDG